jgi:signal transduction histidine kinase
MNCDNEKYNILVVDDEIGMCTGVEKTLKKFSVPIDDSKTHILYNTQSVLTGADFYRVIESNHFDLVLLDYKLPDVTGLELLEYITENKKDTLVIMVTAYATLETAVQSTKIGAYDFLAKPFTPEELRNVIKKATIHLVLAKQARNFEEERRKIRFQFISVLSHELKAPLNAVEGYIDILNKRYNNISEEDYKNFLSRSKIRIDGMRKLIFDLLDLTRIESGEKQRDIKKLNLNEIIKSSVELFLNDAQKRNININLFVNPSLDFYADRHEMEIILNNLISNAVKYNKDNGKVNIKIKKHNNNVKIIVSDTGIGIKKEDIPELFQEFTRIKNENTLHILGSGLGLSTLKKITTLYNGDVRIRSTLKKGTTFIVYLNEINNPRLCDTFSQIYNKKDSF